MNMNIYEYQYRQEAPSPCPSWPSVPVLWCRSWQPRQVHGLEIQNIEVHEFMRLLFGKHILIYFKGIPPHFPRWFSVFSDHCIPMRIPEVSHGMCQAHVGRGSSESRWMGYPAENLGVPVLSPTEEGEEVESQRDWYWSHFVILVLFLCHGAVFSQRSFLVGEQI